MYLDSSSIIRIQPEGVTSDSAIYVDSQYLPGAVTYGWNGASNYNVFHFDNGMEAQLREIQGGLEVFGVLNYINRYWSETYGIVETQETISTSTVNMGLPSGVELNDGFYYVYEDADISGLVQLNGGSTISVVLADGVTVNCQQGILVPSDSTLNIYTQSNDSGTLVATGRMECAGIGGSGGSQPVSCGTVNICGGTINATGNIGAGIGGGNRTGINSINIYGGIVNATGSGSGSAIGLGAGDASNSGCVRIAGGNVTLNTSGSPFINYLNNEGNPGLELPDMCVSKGDECCLALARFGACYMGSTAYSLHIFPCDHHYENGVCTLCGHGVETVAPRFVGHSVQLSGVVGLQFFMTLPDGVNPEDCTVTFQGNNIDTSEEYVPISSDKTGYTSYMVQLNLSTIQIADRYTPTLHYVDSEGAQQSLTGSSYCVMDYIHWGVTQDTNVVTDQEKHILNALADYGYYSQIYTSTQNGWTYGADYATVVLNRRPIGFDPDEVTALAQTYAIRPSLDEDYFSSASFSMRFGDQLSLRVFFVPSVTDIDTSDFTVLCETTQLDPNRYYVSRTSDADMRLRLLIYPLST